MKGHLDRLDKFSGIFRRKFEIIKLISETFSKLFETKTDGKADYISLPNNEKFSKILTLQTIQAAPAKILVPYVSIAALKALKVIVLVILLAAAFGNIAICGGNNIRGLSLLGDQVGELNL